MKRIIVLIICVLFVFALNGCGKSIYPDLPEQAAAFETGSFIDTNDDDAGYVTIEYNGRTYMPYGTIGKTLHADDIDACIGYVITDNSTDTDTDTRLFTLVEDKEHNYLMEHYVATTLMNQPIFYRAVDTRGKTIKTSDFIISLEYQYWIE